MHYANLTEFAVKGLLTRAANVTALRLKMRLIRRNVQYSSEKVHEMLTPILHAIIRHGLSLKITLLEIEGYFLSTPNFPQITKKIWKRFVIYF